MTKTEKERRKLIKKYGAAAYQRMIWTRVLEKRRSSTKRARAK